MGDVCDAVGPGDVEGLTAQSCHDARIDLDPAGVLGEGDVAYPVVPVLDRPMVLDGAREGLGGQHDGRGVERGLPASRPLPGCGGAEQGVAFDAHDGRDQQAPWRAVEGGPVANPQRLPRVDHAARMVPPVPEATP